MLCHAIRGELRGIRVSSAATTHVVELPADGWGLLFAIRCPAEDWFSGRRHFVRAADLDAVGGVVQRIGRLFGDAEERFGEGV